MEPRIVELSERSDAAVGRLLRVWAQSVRATHTFLTEQDIRELTPLVEEALRRIDTLLGAVDTSGTLCGFIGLAENKIEMLFIAPDQRGRGLGRRFVERAVALGARLVDVNEQNPQAVGFYERMGFATVARSPVDGQGKPFPLLHMQLKAGVRQKPLQQFSAQEQRGDGKINDQPRDIDKSGDERR